MVRHSFPHVFYALLFLKANLFCITDLWFPMFETFGDPLLLTCFLFSCVFCEFWFSADIYWDNTFGTVWLLSWVNIPSERIFLCFCRYHRVKLIHYHLAFILWLRFIGIDQSWKYKPQVIMRVSNSQEKLLFIHFSPCGVSTDIAKFPCAESIFFPV